MTETLSRATSGSESILRAENLSKTFGGFLAVKNLSLSIRRGAIHALIGPNGAGKTTVFNLLTKFLQPSSGRLAFDGHDISAASPAEIANLGLVRSFQISAIFPEFTVRENIELALRRKRRRVFRFRDSPAERADLQAAIDRLLRSVDMLAMGDRVAGALPYGRKRALELATTLALEPKMLLLDEPMAGLGREDIGVISALLREASVGRTLLMVEHNLSVVADLAETITVLARGEVLAEGTYASVAADPKVISAYLGAGLA